MVHWGPSKLKSAVDIATNKEWEEKKFDGGRKKTVFSERSPLRIAKREFDSLTREGQGTSCGLDIQRNSLGLESAPWE